MAISPKKTENSQHTQVSTAATRKLRRPGGLQRGATPHLLDAREPGARAARGRRSGPPESHQRARRHAAAHSRLTPTAVPAARSQPREGNARPSREETGYVVPRPEPREEKRLHQPRGKAMSSDTRFGGGRTWSSVSVKRRRQKATCGPAHSHEVPGQSGLQRQRAGRGCRAQGQRGAAGQSASRAREQRERPVSGDRAGTTNKACRQRWRGPGSWLCSTPRISAFGMDKSANACF